MSIDSFLSAFAGCSWASLRERAIDEMSPKAKSIWSMFVIWLLTTYTLMLPIDFFTLHVFLNLPCLLVYQQHSTRRDSIPLKSNMAMANPPFIDIHWWWWWWWSSSSSFIDINPPFINISPFKCQDFRWIQNSPWTKLRAVTVVPQPEGLKSLFFVEQVIGGPFLPSPAKSRCSSISWGFPWPWGYPHSWMVYFMENPIAEWCISWKILSRNGWWLGVALLLETSS